MTQIDLKFLDLNDTDRWTNEIPGEQKNCFASCGRGPLSQTVKLQSINLGPVICLLSLSPLYIYEVAFSTF